MDEAEHLYTLKQAIERHFPGGAITVAALRTEIRHGRLIPERIAGKFFVTDFAIRRMRKLCREKPTHPTPTYMSEKDANLSGTSETDVTTLEAQDVVRAMLKEPTESLPTTSEKSGARKVAGDLIRLPLRT